MALIRADRYVASVDRIDVDELCDEGVRCVLVDRDNTLVPRDTKVVPPEVRDWLGQLKEVGISVCMVSNNFHTESVCASADELGCHVVHHALKPAPFSIGRALRMEGVTADQAVLVGDQVFTDVLAGNLAGVRTVLVRPLCKTDLWFAKPARLIERLFLRGAVFEGE